MKNKNILIISALASTLLGCVHSGSHHPDDYESAAMNPASAFVGTWDQTCGQEHGSIKFDRTMFQLKMGNETSSGSWKINEKNKLILHYGKKKKEKWTIKDIKRFEYTITKGKVTCQGWKKDN